MTKEPVEVIIARIDERLRSNVELTTELLKIVKGENNEAGLMTRVAIVERHPDNCPVADSVKWLSWAVRLIIALPITTMIVYYVKKVWAGE